MCVCVCLSFGGRERESVCESMFIRVRLIVCFRERESERLGEREQNRENEW